MESGIELHVEDHDRVAINLADRDFASNSFLKINLFLAKTSTGDDGEPSGEM